MFGNLSERLESVFKTLRGHGRITEDNIRDAVRDIKRALLEADVNFKVVKDFVETVTQKASGQDVIKSVTPGQQIIKIVHDELVSILGGAAKPLIFQGTPPHKWMLVGLQGSGKTTMCAKLALYYRKKAGKRPLLVAADVYRPAAIDQLETLGRALDIPVFSGDRKNPVQICKDGADFARKNFHDLIIFDTAGRLHIDDDMMNEAANIAKAIEPHELFFTADSMTGQDAVTAASAFNAKLPITGIALTKLDGDARGGAALSVMSVIGKPIRFIGIGEKPDQFDLFHAERMASRILGMGDVVSLVEKAQDIVDEKQAKELEKKIMRSEFTLADFRDQMRNIRKMGSFEQILSMIPGIGSQMKNVQFDEKQLVRIEAIIDSMTVKERLKPLILDGSRRKRIAMGSGTTVNDVNRLLKQFFDMQKMMKRMGKMMGGGGGKLGALKGMASKMGMNNLR
ncbi:MAG: signal recognition particle protein [Fibrobacteres bacterium]|nr:signal recognition particle protein [Fibrobacterota bacterium]